jgi:hypothetical protein
MDPVTVALLAIVFTPAVIRRFQPDAYARAAFLPLRGPLPVPLPPAVATRVLRRESGGDSYRELSPRGLKGSGVSAT